MMTVSIMKKAKKKLKTRVEYLKTFNFLVTQNALFVMSFEIPTGLLRQGYFYGLFMELVRGRS